MARALSMRVVVVVFYFVSFCLALELSLSLSLSLFFNVKGIQNGGRAKSMGKSGNAADIVR